MTETGAVSPVGARNCEARVGLLNDERFVAGLSGIVFSFNRPLEENKAIAWSILRHLKTRHPDVPIVVLGGFINTTHNCSELVNRFGDHAACKRPEYVSYDPFVEQARFRLGNPLFDLDYLYVDKVGLLCSEQNSLASCLIARGASRRFMIAIICRYRMQGFWAARCGEVW